MSLQPLIAEATCYARFTMKKSGSLTPVIIAYVPASVLE